MHVSNHTHKMQCALQNKTYAGDTVSVMALNIPPAFELHFAIPGVRAVINTLNTRYARRIYVQMPARPSRVTPRRPSVSLPN